MGVKVAPEKGAEAVGELLGTYARGRLADMGCRAGSGKDDDLTLDLDVTCRLYDQTPRLYYDCKIRILIQHFQRNFLCL